MGEAEKLAALLERLKANREKVPIALLKTKYKTAYEKLLAEIWEEAKKELIPAMVKQPVWMPEKVRSEYAEEIVAEFDRIYKEGGYAKKFGAALYKNYSISEARMLAGEINRKYREEMLNLFWRKTCLYTTAENWNPENPVSPSIYNDLVDKFWDEDTRGWIRKEKPPGMATLIFITGKEPEKENGHGKTEG